MAFGPAKTIIDGPFSNPAADGGGGPDNYNEGYDAGYIVGVDDSLPDWSLVTGWGSIYDPNSRCSSSSATNGVITMAMAGDTVQYDGYQEACPRFSVQLTSISGMSGFDPTKEDLEVYQEIMSLPSQLSPPAYGVFVALANGNTVASDNAVAAGVRAASAGAVTSQGMSTSAASGGTGSHVYPISGMRYTITFVYAATPVNYVAIMTMKGNSGYGEIFGATNYTVSNQFNPTPTNWYLQAGAFHNNTTTGTPTLQQRIYVRRLKRKTILPTVAPAAKKTSGTLNVLALGDSTMRGYTDNQAPPFGQAGQAIAAGIAMWDMGNPQVNWQNTLNNGPNPGHLEAFARTALLNGFSQVNIKRWASNGRELTSMMTSEWVNARAEYNAALILPSEVDLILISIGTNDAANSTEVTDFTANLPFYLEMIERWFYNARIIFFEPIATTGTIALIEGVNAVLDTAAAAKATRGLVEGTGHASIDGFHQTPATYETDGIAAFTVYQGLS